MKNNKHLLFGIGAACCMVILVLDPDTVMAGTKAAVDSCIRLVVPSLFPFIFLAGVLSGSFMGQRIRLLSPVASMCGVPDGGESLLIVALLGGYPVGAQAVTQAWKSGSISTAAAKRMLGFCSNAGPSFIFGLIGTMFANPAAPWLLWLIHVGSALLVGTILPGKNVEPCVMERKTDFSVPQALLTSLRTMAVICGWVILSRIVLQVADKWFLGAFAAPVQVLLIAALELTNGCLALPAIELEAMRFILTSLILPLGGLCVLMQTVSVTTDLGIGRYITGKVLQTAISFAVSVPVAMVVYQNPLYPLLCVSFAIAVLLLTVIVTRKQKKCSILPLSIV